MVILSAAVGGGNLGDFTLFLEAFKPVLINYVIPIVLALGVIKIIQIISHNMKTYVDHIKAEDVTDVNSNTKPKQQA